MREAFSDSYVHKLAGSPDDAFIEREVEPYDTCYLKEYEFGIDTDDGFDIHKTGLKILNEGKGDNALTISGSKTKDGIESNNVKLIEE